MTPPTSSRTLTPNSPTALTDIATAELAIPIPPGTAPTLIPSTTDLKPLPHSPTSKKNVLYLAYGSNLSRATFSGRRGVNPLSATPVHVPSLDLVFNLAGFPYLEPCMANVGPRVEKPSSSSPIEDGTGEGEIAGLLDRKKEKRGDPADWTMGVVGVVYEVTPEDYAKIWATEGGGSSYSDIVVDCFPLAAKKGDVGFTLEHADKPLLRAHTLSATHPRLLRIATHPQPSLRYLTLIRTGAREHNLPTEYIEFLDSLRHYKVTELRQKVARATFVGVWAPSVFAIMVAGTMLRKEDGASPKWLKLCQEVIWGGMWRSYMWCWRWWGGDGERTVGE